MSLKFKCPPECYCGPGACCLPDGSCVETTAADCASRGGYHLTRRGCGDVNCFRPPPGTGTPPPLDLTSDSYSRRQFVWKFFGGQAYDGSEPALRYEVEDVTNRSTGITKRATYNRYTGGVTWTPPLSGSESLIYRVQGQYSSGNQVVGKTSYQNDNLRGALSTPYDTPWFESQLPVIRACMPMESVPFKRWEWPGVNAAWGGTVCSLTSERSSFSLSGLLAYHYDYEIGTLLAPGQTRYTRTIKARETWWYLRPASLPYRVHMWDWPYGQPPIEEWTATRPLVISTTPAVYRGLGVMSVGVARAILLERPGFVIATSQWTPGTPLYEAPPVEFPVGGL